MAVTTSILCLLLAACGGGGDDTAAPDGGGGQQPPGVNEPAPPRVASLPPGHVALGLPLQALQRLSPPFGTAHDALPADVPPGYDWRERSKRDHGNAIPPGYRAFTGWAQAFWIDGAPAETQRLEVRRNQTLLCTLSGGTRRWHRVQQGEIEGAAFRADYANAVNVPAEVVSVAPDHVRIGFAAGRTYHFWPRQGRITLGGVPLCGMLTLFEARAVAPDGRSLPPGTASTMLAGGGADYWLNTSVPWDHYRTNIGVGVGVLRRVGPAWEWHGMGTADAEALAQLVRDGYVEGNVP